MSLIKMLFGRENWFLVLVLILVGLEQGIRIATILLPNRIRLWFYNKSQRLYLWVFPELMCDGMVGAMCSAKDTVDLCGIHGYAVEEHFIRTSDGYLLCLHRIMPKIKPKQSPSPRPPILFVHGLMMNSEVWVTNMKRKNNLPLVMCDEGYDVWLANLRGNKYSKKNSRYPSEKKDFWDFSLDNYIVFDIPASIDYVLSVTNRDKINLVGFSQGSIILLAAMSMHPHSYKSVNALLAFAPTISPKYYQSKIVQAIMNANSQFLFLLFSRKSLLASVTFWQAVLYPPVFAKIIDLSLNFLLDWSSKNINDEQKVVSLSHLYSFTSVKAFIHWTQIVRSKVIQMFDDNPGPQTSYYTNLNRIARYPVENIKLPILTVYGASDSLVNIDVLKTVGDHFEDFIKVPNYEELDLLFGRNCYEDVYKPTLEKFNEIARPQSSSSASTSSSKAARKVIA
ncbi:triglyceride lipase-cholesterol esterase [Schizosaccharomyces japonicus yFS275]|uniref:Triglyceride lipase-cholesterol esterase n=1 Tax=Schizosaccharomyces japonicus (strain yFS275 / FY16936) TaxID=402676 RepID=B6JZM5_SCHJY|nr:triglyceride lipase-cholesterol esterase [Schizosaccharomyces japonicus yFS275]EEB06993.2 triglyceride lipase-cholesterol esterase [Schizosaccharomyces japonicus yFS275]